MTRVQTLTFVYPERNELYNTLVDSRHSSSLTSSNFSLESRGQSFLSFESRLLRAEGNPRVILILQLSPTEVAVLPSLKAKVGDKWPET